MFCKLCNCEKASGDFYPGVNSRCRECHKRRMKEIRLTNPSVQERERRRAKTPARKAASRRITIEWRRKYPDAYRAQTAVGNAIRDGRLRRLPCFLCGTDKHVHAHHGDYSKPLDVKWLCAKCHHRMHALFPELNGHEALSDR